jgi:hypothetical protein
MVNNAVTMFQCTVLYVKKIYAGCKKHIAVQRFENPQIQQYPVSYRSADFVTALVNVSREQRLQGEAQKAREKLNVQ